jgi:hypothetical protein
MNVRSGKITFRTIGTCERRGTPRTFMARLAQPRRNWLVEIIVDEPYLLQAAVLQIRQGLRHDFVL